MKAFCRLTAVLAVACAAAASAQAPEWVEAQEGVWLEGRLAAAGCANLSPGRGTAQKIALMRAGGILARLTHGATLSGKERMDGERYSAEITEDVRGTIAPLEVIEEVEVELEGEPVLCVLAAERR